MGMGVSGEWIYSLSLTLEELFSGKRCRFGIVRRLLSGKTNNVIVEVDIPSGCQDGSRILCRGAGHELQDGTHQNVAFVIHEATHDRFTRLQDDLLLEIQIPWTECLRRQAKRVCLKGIDGEDISIYIDYSRDKTLTGGLSIRGAGMPARHQGKVSGRGNLVVQ
jgi:DnaJ-class molecular chaperone